MKQDENLYCYYSGLPSPSAYQNKTEIMKGKLIKKLSYNKEHLEYWLYCDELEYTLSPMAKTGHGHGLRKLSISNCQAIEHGYDLDELVEREEPTLDDDDFNEYEIETNINRRRGFIKGAKAILEILGDKKFSEEDMGEAIQFGLDGMYGYKIGEDGHTEVQKNKYIQSLQKTEWDVEVEMEYQDMHDMWFTKPTILSELDRPSRPKITNNSIKIIKIL